MTKPRRATSPDNKVVATVKSVKGNCSWGHEAGDTFEISCHDTANLCGFFYHDIYPYIAMLQFGGGFPAAWGNPDVMTVECMDHTNLVTMELRRVREQQ
ncbi:MAG: TIGR04076 family protein [Chloroflexota bacterium]